jgi:hypothetical protein
VVLVAFRLSPLPLPGPNQVLSEVPSVVVFLDRADPHHRLDRSLDLLGGGRPSAGARHRTLRATPPSPRPTRAIPTTRGR